MQRIMRLMVGATVIGIAGCDIAGGPVGPVVGIGGGTQGNTAVTELTATVNGDPWTATTVRGSFDGSTLTFGGTDGVASLQISVPSLAGAGTFDLGPNSPSSAVAFWIDGTGTYTSAAAGGSGTLDVTTATTSRIAGSFHFTGTTGSTAGGTLEVSVTVGHFDISLP